MSTVFDAVIDSFFETNGVGSGAGTASAREIAPLGLNAEKVVSKRYSLRDETRPTRRNMGRYRPPRRRPCFEGRDRSSKAEAFLQRDDGGHARTRVHPEHAMPRQRRQAKGPARGVFRAKCSRLDRGHHGACSERRDHPPDRRRNGNDIRIPAARRLDGQLDTRCCVGPVSAS